MPGGIRHINRLTSFQFQEFRDLLELNLVSIFTASKFALPHLRRTRGNIINMASLVASIGQRYATTYVATKGAEATFTTGVDISSRAERNLAMLKKSLNGRVRDVELAPS